ncbi:MAG: hypothetical protein ACRC7N_00240 [Clostridium sp.]
MKLKKVKNNYVLIIVSILAISFIMNIYVSWENISYKYRVGESSYLDTEDIRTRNNSNADILEKTINLGTINNEELLQLYRNYTTISNSVIELSNDYNFYKSKRIIIFSKGNITGGQVSKNEIYSRIQDFILQQLNNNMENGNFVINIEGNLQKDFQVLLKLAESVEVFYDDFGKTTLESKVDKEREKMVVNNNYWIDILEGIDGISAEYRDYEFHSIKARLKRED